jgi:hypothetical protein
MRVRKNVLIDEKVFKDIAFRKREFKFNFSLWVQNAYINEFMSLDSKKKELEELEEKRKILKDDINRLEKIGESMQKELNRDERRFLHKIKYMLDEGSTIDGLCDIFNQRFQRNLSLDEFKYRWKVIINEKRDIEA